MGRGKGQYNKNCKRSRQEKQQTKGKYGSPTAIRFRKKLTGKHQTEEIKADAENIFKKNYNACYSKFAKSQLLRHIDI